MESAISETGNHNKNLTASQREILQWHFRLGHIEFIHVSFLARTSRLTVNNPKSVANCDKVKRESCQFGKSSHQPTKTQTVVKGKSKEMELKKRYFFPGQRISVNHFQSALPGRLYNLKGYTDATDIFHGGCIFVDYEYGYIQVRHLLELKPGDNYRGSPFP